jgi:hypothetical protein
MRTAALVILPAVLWATLPLAAAGEPSHSTVGMPARIEQLVLPGPELEARPIESSSAPIVLRIAAVFRHGDAFRYDLVWYGLEPGEFDLRDYLQRKDGSSTADLPAIPITVKSVLPPGQIEPHEPSPATLPWLGGYRWLLWGGGAIWVIGLLVILFWGRKRRGGDEAAAQPPRTLADRLRPLVEQAMSGSLPSQKMAELERLLLAFWRKRLGLEHERPAAAIARLRQHAEAGELLRQLEAWLHAPEHPAEVDLAALLAPYSKSPAE